jgi:hypothetical protein
MKLIDSPDKFLESIPTGIGENIEYRKTLHHFLAKDEGAQKVFLQMCYLRPQIAFNAAFWTFNPRKPIGLRNLPFILRPKQIEAVDFIKDAIDNQHDGIINKSRDEGATEIIIKLFSLYWLIVPEIQFLVGSRKVDYVDKTGDHKCLFEKLKYAVKNLPRWMQPKNIEDTFLHYKNLENNAVIDGESTNESFGAGDRRTATMVDEYGRIDYKIAQCIVENLSDTSDCNIFNSTHFYGIGHPYNQLLQSGKIPVFTLAWEENPEKNIGQYRSPDYNIIEIKDIEYYRKKYPGCFDNIQSMQAFKLSELEKELITHPEAHNLTFIGDGGESNENGWRSVWYDKEEKRRTSRRDMAQNVDRSPMGSGDMFFDARVIQRIEVDTIRKPDLEGEVQYNISQKGRINNIKFVLQGGRKRLKWWGKLDKGRPVQSHNYIVACDISLGTGASNSVASIYDVDAHEKVGIFCCPNTVPEAFADQTVAICHWVGGVTHKPYLIWENNGGQGINFGRRVLSHGYDFVHIERSEDTRTRKTKNKWGWTSTKKTKEDLLVSLRIALSEGLKTHSKHKKLIIHDFETLGEYMRYIWYENMSIGLSECVDESSSARAAHGDRVIPDGLFVLALNYQPKAAIARQRTFKDNSMAYRRDKWKRDHSGENDKTPWLY